MALKHAILALLDKQQMTGYEIKDSFNGPLHLMWNASYGGLYPALHRMEAEGMIKETFIPQRDKPSKKVYSITPKGSTVLQSWFHKPPLPESVKDEFLLKMYLMPETDVFTMETLLAERRDRDERKVEQITSTRKKNARVSLFVDYNLHRYISELKWISNVLNTLKKTK